VDKFELVPGVASDGRVFAMLGAIVAVRDDTIGNGNLR
jgi:hypothetical protein